MFNGTWSDRILSRVLGDSLQAATLRAFVYLAGVSAAFGVLFWLIGLAA